MPGGYEDTHWAATEEKIALFIKKIAPMTAERRSSEVAIEIATQLMWLNAHVEELSSAVHRIADSMPPPASRE